MWSDSSFITYCFMSFVLWFETGLHRVCERTVTLSIGLVWTYCASRCVCGWWESVGYPLVDHLRESGSFSLIGCEAGNDGSHSLSVLDAGVDWWHCMRCETMSDVIRLQYVEGDCHAVLTKMTKQNCFPLLSFQTRQTNVNLKPYLQWRQRPYTFNT